MTRMIWRSLVFAGGLLLYATWVKGQAVRDYAIQPVPFTRVKLTDRFWDPKIRVNATVTIPYILDRCRREGRIDNFLRASKKLGGDKMTEFPFDDTDLYKLIEGASYSLQEQPNVVLERQLDTLIAIIAAAQEPDGYLYTFRTVHSAHPHEWIGEKRWVNEEVLSHELYNSGHLYESAVAHYQATGKRSLLDVALKNADLLVRTFGYGKEMKYPGHQIVEMGLVKLYRVTGKKEYLDLAKFFLDIRGGSGDAYNQADKKVTDQHQAEGHAVRAAYMYTGMADVAALTGDSSYLRAIDDIWSDVVNKKLYVTGGIGATGNGEAFGDAYDLPNMSAYAETCAAIGNVYWNIRMFLLHGDAKYIDVLEKTLYNGLLSGMSLSGNRFFYPNPLASMGQHSRSSWFSCACCITNMTRFLPSVPGYVYAQEGDNVYVNLFMSNEATIALRSGKIKISQQTDYPWNGRVAIAVDAEGAGSFDLRIRIPGWASGEAVPGDLYSFASFKKAVIPITVNGQAMAYRMEKGYAVIRRRWRKGDRVVVDLPMPVEKVVANEQVKADRGRFALQKGPIIYCLEGVDHKDSMVQSIVVDKKEAVGSVYEDGLLRGVTVLTTEGYEAARGPKSSEIVTSPEAVKAIPYYSWNNRGTGEMEVWIPYQVSAARPKPAATIASGSRVSASLYNKRMYAALNDQYDPVDSKDNSALYLHWWPKKDSEEWVQYDFSREYTVSSSKVYWFDDGPWGGCRVPAWWKLYYKKDGQWVPVENSTPYGTEKDKYNEVRFTPVKTSALRLMLKLPADNSAGIHEWVVDGPASGGGEARPVERVVSQAEVQVDPGVKGAAISSTLHGIFFEEISHAGEGGLYAEMIQNRGFEDSRLPPGTVLQGGTIVPQRTPHFMLPDGKSSDWTMPWNVKTEWPGWSGGAGMRLSLTDERPLNSATPHSLHIAFDSGRAELVNSGFWGMNVVAGDRYFLSFYARDPGGYKGAVTASLRSEDGKVLAEHVFDGLGAGGWKKYTCTLQAVRSDAKARFVLEFGGKGSLWLDFVSLFPEKTFRGRPNGLRADLAQYIADMKPAFIRWPGGCYVEGINIQSAPDWKRTIGPVEKRLGTYSPWGYWSSDGFGYDEYLRYCEDIGAAALYVFNVGVSCEYRSGTFIPDDSLGPVIQNALDAIEYAIGSADSKWGRVRAANGHPAPYPLKYVEVGNEQHGQRYSRRYNRFYEAIRQKYPSIRIVASMGIGDVNRNTLDSMRAVDMADEHAYKGVYWSFSHFNHFDKYKRGSWEMYVGEYATNGGVGSGNMAASLSDAVYMMAMEKNSDLVKMSSYAPLLVNVNDVSWPVNLINFDAGRSFARISYYAIRMFNENRPDVNLSTSAQVSPGAAPEFSGGIGLGTWDTQTDYKDIKVEQDGKVVYESDLLNRAGEWLPVRGEWKTEDGSLQQTAAGAQRLAVLKGRSFDAYTLTLKARKRSGYNAFIIPFALKDSNTYLRAHIGCYVNSHSVFERVTDGYEVVGVSDPVRLKKPIDTGRWYTVRLEVKADRVDCFLDGELLMSYTEPPKLFAISGRDSVKGDIIVKMVNAGAAVSRTRVRIGEKAEVGPEASLITLSAADETAENSFEHPTEHIPVTTKVGGVSNNFELELKPYSINVLRLKDLRWNK